METRKIASNLDTGFLKLVAIISMTFDHVGSNFFPDMPLFRIIGRLAFPIFAYCVVVGCLYTHDVKRYALRLGAFALLSQPIYALPGCESLAEYWERLIWSPNIFFTLLVGLGAVYGVKEKKWWLTAAAVLFSAFVNVDYGAYGVILMVLFCLLRNKRWLSCLVVALYLGMDLMQLPRWPYIAALQGFSLLSLPLIYAHTNVGVKVNKYVFYSYYPAHLLAIFLIQRLWGLAVV